MTLDIIGRKDFQVNEYLEQSLIPQLVNDTSKRIIEILIQQSNLASICFFSLISKRWKLFIESKIDIFLSQIFFQIKRNAPCINERLKNYSLNPEKKEFSNQEFKLLDQAHKLCPQSLEILLSYDSPLFQSEDLALRVLHRYQWILEETIHSKNKAIRKIAFDSLLLLKSFISADSQAQRLNFIQNDFSKLYLMGKSKLMHSLSKTKIINTFDQIETIEDSKLILDIMKYWGIQYSELHVMFRKDRQLALAIVKLNGFDLQYADASLRQDREIVLEAVKQNGKALQYADVTLKQDREIVLEAVKQNGNALRYANTDLKRDREIMLEAIKHKDFDILCADASFRRDREMMLEAIKQNGKVLEYVDDILKQDREIVLEAVKQNGYLFQYASQVLKKDPSFVLTLISISAPAIEFADPSLLRSKDFLLKAIEINYYVFQYLNDNCRWKNEEFLLEAVDRIASKLLT